MNKPAADPQHLIAFLPWVVLRDVCHVAGVDFVAFRDGNGKVHPPLADVERQIARVLSSYVDLEDVPVENCTIALMAGNRWDLTDADLEAVDWAASLLFLACWAQNEYYPKFFGHYVSSTNFRATFQRFTG